ncbi:TIGR02391 family protein [Aeromonas aquatica]|uniref:TIGR02391 family protein n=1 Tax=Aeromonas aquatica TaxID=558964 RepID=UPI00286ED118|nr:TIGR02391 family protein [Aeromonas aquatica]
MNGYQKKALQEKLLEEIVDIYGDNFLRAATSLIDIGHDVSSAINKALIQVSNNPKFGLRSFLKSCSEAAILQMATHYNIAMPDALGRVVGEGVQAQWELRFNERDFHTGVVTHSKALFLNEHYANAVHETCKVYIRALQAKSGSSKDGADLMSVLSPKGNVKFNAYSTDSEKNYQQGLEYISRGVVSAFRNITAHDMAKSLDMSAIEALDMLSTVSLLLKALDKATVSNEV